LGELSPHTVIPFDDVFPPFEAAGRMFNRLRNEALASLRADDQVLVVAGASRGSASTLVAANLAAALGRGGSEVVLICAHLPESLLETAPATRLLGVDATPGLSEVLAGKVGLAEAVQRAPRNPWLRVLTTGGTASAGGLLQSPALRETLDRLRDETEYIVIEAPSTAASADAQSLASLADVAILAVELRRTSLVEVLDAAVQLRRVGTPLLGAVVLPRLPTDIEPAATGRRPNRPALHTAADAPTPRTSAAGDAPTARMAAADTRIADTARMPAVDTAGRERRAEDVVPAPGRRSALDETAVLHRVEDVERGDVVPAPGRRSALDETAVLHRVADVVPAPGRRSALDETAVMRRVEDVEWGDVERGDKAHR
jgi:Mrp family chromosome partitioning ATPase